LSPFVSWLNSFIPPSVHVSKGERLRGCVGALIGIVMTAGITRLTLGPGADLPLLVAPMGASAVLLFAVPASPLAQPWSLIGGNLVASLVGVACAHWIGNPVDAAAVAIAISIGGMFSLRCVHPPSGAVALTAVLGGPAIHALGYRFALMPIGINSIALLGSAIVYHGVTRHRYPHRPHVEQADAVAAADRQSGFTRADLDAVLDQRDEFMDVDVDDLREVLGAVEARAYRRSLGDLTCENVMASDVRSVAPDATADSAWALLQRYRIKALPVIDADARVVGIVTQTDFIRHAKVASLSDLASYERAGSRRASGGAGALVGDLMTAPVRTALLTQPIVELVPMFSACGHHHLPVIDGERRLRGMVTQANLVAGLHRHSIDEIRAAA
jgi:CBS domain-containing membrane protein